MADIDNLTFYRPAFRPELGNLNDKVEVLDREQETQERVDDRIRSALKQDKAPGPISLEEAREIDKRIDKTIKRAERVRARIAHLKSEVDRQANPDNGQEAQFALDMSNKPNLKRAVRRVFKKNTDTITYSMYKQALAMKRDFEEQDAESYLGDDNG